MQHMERGADITTWGFKSSKASPFVLIKSKELLAEYRSLSSSSMKEILNSEFGYFRVCQSVREEYS